MRPRAAGLVWNGNSRRPRLPWRLLAGALVLLGLGLGAARARPSVHRALLDGLSAVWAGPEATAAAEAVGFVLAQVTVTVGTVYLVGRFVDRRPLRDFGLRVNRGWWLDFGFGLVVGTTLISGVFVVELAAGWVVVDGTYRIAQPSFSFWPWFGWGLVTFVAVGTTEELLARGYLLTNLAEGLTWFDRIGRVGAVGLGVVLTSLLFGWAHLGNPNAGPGTVVGVTAGAVMLAAGYVLTGELAIPIGLHVAWNFVQGPVFGFPVSGVDFGVSLLAIEQGGPAALTGGAFGPEAGLLGMGASLLGTGTIAAWARWRQGGLRVHPSLTTPEHRGDRGEGEVS